jgi:hypothetical protein
MTNDTPLRSAALEMAAQCWCEPSTSDSVMDVALATVFASRLEKLMTENAALRTALGAPKEPSEPDVEAECALIEKAARVAFEPLRKQYAMSVIGRYSGDLAYPGAFAKAMSEIWRKGRPAALGAESREQLCPLCNDEMEPEWFCFGCDEVFVSPPVKAGEP